MQTTFVELPRSEPLTTKNVKYQESLLKKINQSSKYGTVQLKVFEFSLQFAEEPNLLLCDKL